MADIDFNGGKGINANDPKFDKDIVNLRTLKGFIAALSANTVSAVVSGITAGNNISITGSTSAITISLSGNVSINTFSANTVSATTYFSGSTPLETIIATYAVGGSGYSGYSGRSGYSGVGNSGYSGYSGIGNSGYSGYSGVGSTGASGYSGIGTSGYSGFSGIDGTSGYSGYSGSGASGYSGIGTSGYSGYSGFSGIDGSSGYSGFSGSGVSGYSGYSGTSGFSGLTNLVYIQDGLNTYTGGTVNLPTVNISGATLDNLNVSGTSVFASATANTLSINNYIDFATGNTIPNNVSGRVFYNKDKESLSYFPNANQDVVVNIGQQQYIRVNNASGTLISKGSVVCTVSALSGTPSVTLAISTGQTGNNIIGLAAHNIQIGEQGLVITQGLLSGLTLNTFTVGQNIYLSDTIPGGYIGNSSSLALSSRINLLGYITATGITSGQIFVKIVNENSEEDLTIKVKNLLVVNSLSTGVYSFSGIVKTTSTTFSVAPVEGWIVKNAGAYALTGNVVHVSYSGTTGTGTTTPYFASSDDTHVMINSASTLVLTNIQPTPEQRRDNIFLGTVLHPSRTQISHILNNPDFDVSPISQLRDMFEPIKMINSGIVPSSNGATLNFKTSAGELYGLGIGWVISDMTPDSFVVSGSSPVTFAYRTQTGGTSGDITLIDPTSYDVGGVITSVPLGTNKSTNQRIYLYQDGIYRIQYGQTVYNDLTSAIAAVSTESFISFDNVAEYAILIGVLSVRRSASDLSDINDARFTLASKFGETVGGTGGISTTTLQQAYNNSTTPEIVINSILDGLSIKNGTGNADSVTNLIEGQNSTGATTSFIRADGSASFDGLGLSATTYYSGATPLETIIATYAVGASGYSGYSGKSGYSGYSGYSGVGSTGASGYSGYSGVGTSGYSGYSGSGVSGFSGYSGSGISGYSGYSGTDGTSGYSGYSGSGVSGFSGYSGSGVSGFSGYSGYSGVSGFSGYSGSGVSGYSGYSGISGFSGYSGYSGINGTSGYSGYSGSGVSGFSGYSGTSGFSGYSGYSGTSGFSGYSGSGVSGYSGYSGYSGISGFSGYSGSGVSGFSGYSGIGTSGYSGYSGTSGFSGYSGIGTSGFSGYSGTSGFSGYSGSGVSGYSGYSGINGTSGYSGYSGFSGSGISGYSGYSGINGTSGFSGYSGYSGINGVSGYSGYSGVGISGYSGYSGTSGYSGYSGIGTSGYSGYSGKSGYSGYSGGGTSGYSGYSGGSRTLVSITQSATPTINTNNGKVFNISALAQDITSMTTNLSGSPVDPDLIEIRITDDGNARNITWGASFSGPLLPTKTVAGVILRVGFEYYGTTWNCIAVI